MTVNYKIENGKKYYKLTDIARLIKVTSLDYAEKKSGIDVVKFKDNHIAVKYVDEENINKLVKYFKDKGDYFADYGAIVEKWISGVNNDSVETETEKVNNSNDQDANNISDNPVNELMKKFISQQFGLVRVVVHNNDPWFVAADVCRALEIGNPTQALTRLDEDEKSNTLISNEGNRGNPNVAIINEPGLYSLVLGSRKPEAKAFKRWITHEVIPAIRNHGVYATAETAERLMNDPDFMIKTFTALKEEREKNRKLTEENDRLNVVNQGLVHDTKTWDKRAVLTRLMRCLAFNGGFNGNYQYAYNTLYSELRYKKGICLSNRTGGKTLSDRIHENEWMMCWKSQLLCVRKMELMLKRQSMR